MTLEINDCSIALHPLIASALYVRYPVINMDGILSQPNILIRSACSCEYVSHSLGRGARSGMGTVADQGQVYFDFVNALFTSSGSKSSQLQLGSLGSD
jgi:hypothetical protein